MQILSGAPDLLPQWLYSKVARYRHKVFVGQLGWELRTQDGAELDQLDRPDIVYVVAQDDEGQIFGRARLLPTTRPYLLFSMVCCRRAPLMFGRFRASRQWTSIIRPRRWGKFLRRWLSSCFRNRLLALPRMGHGAKRLIAVSVIGVKRLLCRAGSRAHQAGPPMIIDGHPIFACWIERN